MNCDAGNWQRSTRCRADLSRVLALKIYNGPIRLRSTSLRGVVERGAMAPLFIYRHATGVSSARGIRSHHATISSRSTDRSQVSEMVASCLLARAAREGIDDVAERSRGVPLFVEEVTRLFWSAAQRRASRQFRRLCNDR